MPSPITTTITTPIFYVNSKPHIGHAYTCILSDAISKWNILKNQQSTYLISGTDEHGQKILQASIINNQSVNEFCNTMSGTFENLLTQLHIRPNSFIRTTSKTHQTNVQSMWKRIKNQIEPGKFEGWY